MILDRQPLNLNETEEIIQQILDALRVGGWWKLLMKQRI